MVPLCSGGEEVHCCGHLLADRYDIISGCVSWLAWPMSWLYSTVELLW